MASLMTVLGLIPISGLGIILPHEHLFTDLRGPRAPGYGQADVADVVGRLRPHLEELRELGVSALVEPSTVGVGRNVRVLRALAEAVDLPVVAPTGAYRDEFIPDALRSLPQQALTDWMVSELSEGIEGTGIRAGFIKLATSQAGLTPLEERLLRAAAAASLETGAAIMSHTLSGAIALRQVEILEEEGVEPREFIWAHAQREPDPELHLRLARRGAYVEYDTIGGPNEPDSLFVDLIRRLWDGHCGARVLLSQDAGWYRPEDPQAPIRGYGYLLRTFVPSLERAGFGRQAIPTMLVDNPQYALAVDS